jgi:beta-N-acetylhexosaminidase
MVTRGLLALTALISGAFGAVSTPARVRAHARAASTITLPNSETKLLGQRIMVGFDGTRAPRWLLSRVRAGEIGAVILFASNIAGRAQLTALTRSLQRAAGDGGNPPLLIATDQEGGEVKRLPHGPPGLSPPQIAATGSTGTAFDEGRATGVYLKRLGINMDLAPVLDVPTFPGAFIWRQGRAFSFSAPAVSRYASAFALGIQSAQAAATAKHFPGVGSAAVDTDDKLDVLRPTGGQLEAALLPYEALIPRGLDAVMLSTAAFPAYDPTAMPAALSRPIIQGLLRRQLGFGGVTITDALGTPTGRGEIAAGVLAARAGADVLLYTDSAPGELAALSAALRHGRINRAEAQASYRRIVALKRRVA